MKTNLTDGARQAIRSYIISLVAIPGVAVAVMMFFLGYFIKDVAATKAYNDAFKEQLKEFTNLRVQASAAQMSASDAKDEANDAKDDAKKAKDDAENAVASMQKSQETANSYLDHIQELTKSDKLKDEVSLRLSNNPTFLNQLQNPLTERITVLEADYRRLRKR